VAPSERVLRVPTDLHTDYSSVSTCLPENFRWSFGWVLRTPNLGGRVGHRGLGMVPFKRVVSSYRPSIVTFPPSLCFRDIGPLLCSSMPLFTTTPLVSPKFPHVPLGVGGWHLGYKEKAVGPILRAISSQDFQRV